MSEASQLRDRLNSELHRCVVAYTDQALQDKARECIPVDDLHVRAHAAVEARSSSDPTSFEEELMRELLRWFKRDFFRWVNSPPCEHCEAGTQWMRSIRVEGPASDDERRGGASRVEVYSCGANGSVGGSEGCGNITRFPRYNDPGKLLETRRGRCGEWANCFCLMTQTLGFRTRYILDFTDHVWTEVFISRTQRWTHVDACEEAYDTPLLYEKGWGKRLSLIFAFDADAAEVVDVFQRYSRSDEAMARRAADWDLDWLAELCEELTVACQTERGIDDSSRSEILVRRIEEEELLDELFWEDRVDDEGEEGNAVRLPGRQSGSLDWRTARGECGVASIAPPVPTFDPTMDPLAELLASPSPDRMIHVGSSSSSSAFLGFLPKTLTSPVPCIVLTPSQNDCRGATYVNGLRVKVNDDGSMHVSTPDASADEPSKRIRTLVVQFTFRITTEHGLPALNGADGFAFIIQNHSSDALGSEGSGLGYSGLSHTLAVEFDTYRTTDFSDPNDNHVAIMASPFGNAGRITPAHDGALACQYGVVHENLPRFNDGRFYVVRIFVERRRCYIEISDDIEARIGSFVKILESRIDLRDILIKRTDEGIVDETDPGAWIGFTAATGGLNQAHQVGDIKVWGIKYALNHPRAKPKSQ